MKKNFLTRVITITIAAAMALTPVTASAAEKKVVTRDQVDEYWDNAWLEAFGYDVEASKLDNDLRDEWLFNIDQDYLGDSDPRGKKANEILYSSIKSLDGCYQENGNKIYTILNGSKKTFKKTGSYSIIVGGKTAKKDEGTFKFVAPKTGTYKFTFTTKDNVAGEQIFIDWDGGQVVPYKVSYKAGSLKITKDADVLVTDNAKHVAIVSKGGNVLSSMQNDKASKMTKVSGSIKLKKGQYVQYVARSSHAAYDEDEAYNFTGFDVTITKTK